MQGLINDFRTHMEALLGVKLGPVVLDTNECARLEVPLTADGGDMELTPWAEPQMPDLAERKKKGTDRSRNPS